MSANLPKAYKEGFQDFYGRNFKVSPSVLIPRPESEMIIDAVLSLAGRPILPGVRAGEKKIDVGFKILDVGTGSGCLAVTLSLLFPDSRVVAVDVSDEALGVARENSSIYGAMVEFLKSDLLSCIDEKFDVIVANLPYVNKKWGWLNMDSLSAEPELALFAEDDGLFLIKKLIRQVFERNCTKYLILESDPCQHEDIKKYASQFNMKHIETRGFIQIYSL